MTVHRLGHRAITCPWCKQEGKDNLRWYHASSMLTSSLTQLNVRSGSISACILLCMYHICWSMGLPFISGDPTGRKLRVTLWALLCALFLFFLSSSVPKRKGGQPIKPRLAYTGINMVHLSKTTFQHWDPMFVVYTFTFPSSVLFAWGAGTFFYDSRYAYGYQVPVSVPLRRLCSTAFFFQCHHSAFAMLSYVSDGSLLYFFTPQWFWLTSSAHPKPGMWRLAL